MAQGCQIILGDMLTGKNPWKDQIQSGDFVIDSASWDSQDGDTPHIGDHKHCTGQDRGSIIDFSCSRKKDALPSDIIRINAHPSTKQNEITSTVYLRSYRTTYPMGIIWNHIYGFNHRGKRFKFLSNNWFETIFNQTGVDLVTRDYDPRRRRIQGDNGKDASTTSRKRRGTLDHGPFHYQRDCARGPHEFAFFNNAVLMQGCAHHLINHVEFEKQLSVNNKESVLVREKPDFTFSGFRFAPDAFSRQGVCELERRLVFMNLILFEIYHIEMIFPQAL